MRHRVTRRGLMTVMVAFALLAGSPVRAADDVVNAVLFYRPDCPHCHVVMTEVLPPLKEQYGDRLVIAEVDTTTPQGSIAWKAALGRFDLARGDPPRTGVPTLIIGEHNLVGSIEIPTELPALIEMYLAEGGAEMPDLPGLQAEVQGGTGAVELNSAWATVWDRYASDLAGNMLSTIVLLALVGTAVVVLSPAGWQPSWSHRLGRPAMMIAILVGLGAASYLAYVETTGASAICGPVGDCNAVQQSPYARLLGFLPVAVLGVIGYVAILTATIYGTWIRGKGSEIMPALVLVMALFGLAFSIYLTFLEPFVIGATCAWCLTSAVCMMVVALASAGSGWASLRRLVRDLRSTSR